MGLSAMAAGLCRPAVNTDKFSWVGPLRACVGLSTLVLLATVLLQGSMVPTRALQEASKIAVDVPLVTVNVWVMDSSGNSVTGLAKEDFEVYENEKQQPIQYFGKAYSPHSFLLVIDRSQDLQDYWPLVIASLSRILSELTI